MRSAHAAIGLIGILLLVPAASAFSPLPDLPAAPAPGVGGLPTDGIAEEIAEAAGISQPSGGLPVVEAPADAIGPQIPWLAVAAGAASLAGLAAAGVFFGGARFVTPADVLQNDVRQRIYAHIKAQNGANLKDITDSLSLTTTNAIWHLRKLEDAGLLHSRRFNGYKIFYAAAGGVEARRMSLGKTALANGNAQEVFEKVVAQPGTHQREIARALGVNHGTVRWHLKRLMDAELIIETRRGKASAYEPTAMGLAAMREVTRSPAPSAPATDVAVTAA